MTFWLNGEWRDEAAAIRIDDRGFLLGDGVFETILVRNGAPVFLNRHLARLSHGLKTIGLRARAPEGLTKIIRELSERNGAGMGDASVRLTVTRGPGFRGLAPPDGSNATMLLTCAPARSKADTRVLIISRRRRATSGDLAQCKTLAYLENILAMNDAAAAGADDALMVNASGRIVCASAANIFAIKEDGVVITPALEEGALGGIVRAVLIDAAPKTGVVIEERAIAPADLKGCALFLSNSLIGIAPARLSETAHAGAEIMDGRASEIFNRLNACYKEALEDDLRKAATL